MLALPRNCRDINPVRSFCDCIADEDSVDEAAQTFCQRVATGGDPYVTGDDLVELKKALLDLEE